MWSWKVGTMEGPPSDVAASLRAPNMREMAEERLAQEEDEIKMAGYGRERACARPLNDWCREKAGEWNGNNIQSQRGQNEAEKRFRRNGHAQCW